MTDAGAERLANLERLYRLMRSYNPKLPMGAGMAAQFAAIMADCEPAPCPPIAFPALESGHH